MAAGEEKAFLALYRSYLREHVGQIRSQRGSKPTAAVERQHSAAAAASIDRRLKPQNLLLLPDNQNSRQKQTYPSMKIAMVTTFAISVRLFHVAPSHD